MKRVWILLLMAALCACDPLKDASDTAARGAADTVGQVDRSKSLSDLTTVTAAMQGYYMQHNKYPDKLADLKLRLYHPEDLVYDPKTGKVRSKSFPDQ